MTQIFYLFTLLPFKVPQAVPSRKTWRGLWCPANLRAKRFWAPEDGYIPCPLRGKGLGESGGALLGKGGTGWIEKDSTAGRLHPSLLRREGLVRELRTLPLGRSNWGKNYCFPESSARFRLIPSFSEFPSVEARWLLILAHQKAPLTEGGELWLVFLFPYLPHAPFPKPYL